MTLPSILCRLVLSLGAVLGALWLIERAPYSRLAPASGGPGAHATAVDPWSPREPGPSPEHDLEPLGGQLVTTWMSEAFGLSFGDGARRVAAGVPAGDVPVIAGASRVLRLEQPGWLLTVDEPARVSTAVEQLAVELGILGWREAGRQASTPLGRQPRQRVFSRPGSFCLVDLQEVEGNHYLITVVGADGMGLGGAR